MAKGSLHRKRPCSFCRKWFYPDARVGERQYACSDPKCQQKRHQCNCKEYHQKNSEWIREERLRERLKVEGQSEAAKDPTSKVDRVIARDEIGWKATVIIEEYAKTIYNTVRDERLPQPAGIKGINVQHSPSVARDEIALSRRPP